MRQEKVSRALAGVALLFSVFAFSLAAPIMHAQTKAATWKATEVWRTDGGESGEPFADLRDYVVLKDGTLWALDFKFQDIRRYGADGRPLNKIARKGQGPGELANANGMLVANDGTVWVNDPSNSRYSVFAPDGKFLRQHLLPIGGYGYRWNAWADRASGDVVEQRMGRAAADWRRIDGNGRESGSIPMTSCPDGSPDPGTIKAATPNGGQSFSTYPFSRGGGLAADGNGAFWCAGARGTRVALVRAGKSDTIMQIPVEYRAMPVVTAEREAAIQRIEKSNARYATNDFDKSKIPTTKPRIAALHVDADGRLWVQQSAVFGAKTTTFDVFDAKGKQLGQLVIAARQNTAMPIRAQGKLLWLTILDDDDVPYIVHYRLQQ